jgi:hypothetical protein
VGNEQTDKSISGIYWRFVHYFSAALQQEEREAVLGDLAESGENGGKALRDVLGLVVRRQAMIWKDWRLWLVVTMVVVPVSLLLSIVSQNTSGETAVYTWMYANNWDWALTKSAGFWYVFGEVARMVATDCLLLACWSWSAGFLFGCLPTRLLRVTRTTFLLLLGLSQLASAPQHIMHLWIYLYGMAPLPSNVDPNAPVTAIALYNVIFPYIVLGLLVALPAFWGLRQSKQTTKLSPKLRLVFIVAAIIAISTTLPQIPGFGLLLGASGRQWLWENTHAMRMLSFLAYWPTLYLVAMGFRRYTHKGALA